MGGISSSSSRDSRQCARSTPAMITKTLSVFLTCIDLLFVQALGFHVSQKNDIIDASYRVYFGNVANPADFPFLIRLHQDHVICGAAIITNHFIVTAAHCIFDLECSAIEIFPSTWSEGQVPKIHAAQCYVHEQYVDPRSTYDIALIKTLEDLLNDGKLRAIPLPAPGTIFPPGTEAVVVGWGITEAESYPDHLLKAVVKVEDWDECNYKYKHSSNLCISDTYCPVGDIPKRVLCTQGEGSTPPSTCYGDSGGPVIIDGVLAGVVFGTILVLEGSTCAIGSPSLHTSIKDYLPWIYSFTEPDRDTSNFPVVEEPRYRKTLSVLNKQWVPIWNRLRQSE